ncbi:MAG TPA: AAA family ATPase, partial [Burkholderiaceae bacterium]|nr:AAA family ATPase [Burkholderiaceae bacterium]
MTPAASHAVTGSSPALLESKLVPPHLTLNLLARTQLSTLLQLGLAKRMVTVAAPAGYGKSTALSQFSAWADKQALVTAWLSLDAEDNDPLRFVHYLAGALNHADRDLGRGALAQIGAGNISSIEAIVASLVHDLATCGRRVVLVLDDFHVIENDLVHRKLEWLIAHTPPTVLFVLAGRTRLPLAVSQLRMRDELLELDTSHLCLRLEEAAEFVSRISGAALDRRHVETLHGLTEGWIAALQLASLALRQSDDKAAFLAAFSGTDRDITDYLGEQVLDSLPAEIRAFLLSTALLDRFCADLCDDVLSRADSRAMLAEVQARNLFLIGLDRTRTWFRYHHLFADYLRTRGREERPAQARAIYRRASAWFDQHGLRHEAVRYAFEGGDLERAADLVGAFSAELVQHRGEHATLLSWLARLPADLVHARPKIRIGHAWSLVLTRRYAEADRELKELERGSVSEHDDDVRCVVEMIRCVYFALTDQAVLAKEKADAWLESWPRAEVFLTGVVANVFAFGCCETDDFERGVQALALARRSFAQRNAHYGTAWSSALSMLISIRRGDY